MDALRRTDAEVGELRALLVLDQLPGVGPVTVRRAVERFGSATAALAAPARAFAEVAGGAAATERSSAEVLALVDGALDRTERIGIRTITWSDGSYPRALRALADPPPVLFLQGRPELLSCAGVTVVGGRRATHRARDVARRLAQRLAGAGVAVVSGLALGVDGAAHRGALEAGGDTVAVLGTGADVPYPRAHVALCREISRRGLVVSEFLPGTPALPHHFPRRNRILAALGSTTVVVEAGARSGSLITVDHALDLGRDVWVVPGPIERAPSAGSNRLLVEGARPLLSVEHFVSEIAPAGSGRVVPDVASALDESVGGAGSPTSVGVRVVVALGAEPQTVDQLAARLGLPVHAVLGTLTELEVEGRVRRLPGSRFGMAA